MFLIETRAEQIHSELYRNEIWENAIAATITGGSVNRIGVNASYAGISGGYINTNNGSCATVPGGK